MIEQGNMSSLPPTIGPYRTLRPIARGGMAEVYEVEDPISGEHLALKLLMKDGPARARFDREYEAMIRLNHPNIVRVYSYGTEGEQRWLSMELIDGTPIQAYAKRCGRPGSQERTDEVMRISHDLARALDHIHRRGLVHRDLKSANVLVLPDGRVKLLDFGTAQLSDPLEQITQDGEFIGTFAYASPEQLTGGNIEPRSDLYSLGILMYRLATGKRPFTAKKLHDLARQQVKERPKPPRELIPTLPQALEDLILALLEKKVENRPSTGEDVATKLEEIAGRPLLLPGTLDVDQSSERLVGREHQMAALWSFIDGGGQQNQESLGSHPADVALIVGRRGSGRHRVITSLENEVSSRGWRSSTAYFQQTRDDINTLLELFQKIGEHFMSKPASIQRAIDTLTEVENTPSMPVAERLERLRSSAHILLTVLTQSSQKPVALFVCGLQNAGPIGFEVLVALRETVREAGLPVLLIGDISERADDPETMCRKRLPDALRVYFPPLNVREVALLVGSLLNRRPPPAMVARQIYDASGGLPTYVEEVVKGMVSRGLLRVRGRDPNRIEWGKNRIEIPVPKGARLRVIDSLARLPVGRRRVLEALAVLGGEGSTGVLAASLDTTYGQIVEDLNELVNEGWIALEDDPGFPYARWRQVLAERVVLEHLHPCRRRVLERKLIELVANEPAFTAQIKLLLQADRVDEALERSLDWAIHHLSRNRPNTALDVLDLVVPVIDKGEHTSNTTRAQLYLLHVTSLLMARPTDPQTARSLARADELGQVEGELFQAEIDVTRARLQRVIGHYPNFRKFLMKAWNLIEHQPPSPLSSTVADLLGWSNRVAGLVDDAAAWHGRARRIAVQVGLPTVRAHSDIGVAGWQLCRGLLLEAERTVVGAIKSFDEAGDPGGISVALPIWGSTLRLQGRFTEVHRVLYQQVPVMRESESASLYVRVMLAAAECENDLCRLGRAQECIEELAAALRRGEHLDLRLLADLVSGQIQLASSELDEAEHTLKRVMNRGTAAGLVVLSERARAQYAAVQWHNGDQVLAQQLFEQATSALARSGDVIALVDAVITQGKAMCTVIDPTKIYAPIQAFINSQPAPVASLEFSLAQVRWKVAHDEDPAEPAEEALKLLKRIHRGLSETDRAALRLHPWTYPLRRAGITIDFED